MIKSDQNLSAYIVAAIYLIGTMFLAFIPNQNDFVQIAISYFPIFILYCYIIFTPFGENNYTLFFGLAILCRFFLIFSFPNLSDDIYRFIWDGNLIENGLNPFEILPSDALDEGYKGIDPKLYKELNSQEYYTIYPPVCQGIFGLSALLSEGIHLPAIIMKCFMFLFEIGSLVYISKCLAKLSMPKSNVLIYALNPLIILEIMGNLHFEGAMIFFLVLCFFLLLSNKIYAAALAMALSVCSKLLPLMFLPALLKKIGFKKSILFYALTFFFILLLFLPLLSEQFFSNFANSVDLYFRKFEFNASIYYLLRYLGQLLVGYNLIALFGPMLGIISLTIIIILAFTLGKNNFGKWPLVMLFSISTYLLLTTTVHPWYLSLPLATCLFTKYRFPVIWSGLIMLTYINYSTVIYVENLWIVSFEYQILFAYIIYELVIKKRNSETRNSLP